MPGETSYEHFQDAMAVIADRLRLLQEWPPDDCAYIFVVESYALHLRKIVEGLAFAALSAFEHSEGALQHLHRKDPDALLRHHGGAHSCMTSRNLAKFLEVGEGGGHGDGVPDPGVVRRSPAAPDPSVRAGARPAA